MLFYTHAHTQENGGANFNVEDLDKLLDYIVNEKEISILKPSDAIKEYFTLKPSEYINLLNA